MRRAALLLGILLLVTVPATFARPAVSLQVQTDTGALVWCGPVARGDSVQLQFTHSMFGGYVRESWRISPDYQFERVRFVTENAAAAEYYATDGTSYQASDGYVVPGGPLLQNQLVIRVNTRGNHILRVGDSTIRLADELPQSTQVRISIRPGSCTHTT